VRAGAVGGPDGHPGPRGGWRRGAAVDLGVGSGAGAVRGLPEEGAPAAGEDEVAGAQAPPAVSVSTRAGWRRRRPGPSRVRVRGRRGTRAGRRGRGGRVGHGCGRRAAGIDAGAGAAARDERGHHRDRRRDARRECSQSDHDPPFRPRPPVRRAGTSPSGGPPATVRGRGQPPERDIRAITAHRCAQSTTARGTPLVARSLSSQTPGRAHRRRPDAARTPDRYPGLSRAGHAAPGLRRRISPGRVKAAQAVAAWTASACSATH
jgi:hypothetical protein